jgi:hypothetical protein
MRKLIFVLAFFCITKAKAQNYLISFSGTGASTTVNSIKVENLTKGTSLTLNGTDILRLTTLTGINTIEKKQTSELKIYPNPTTDKSTIEFTNPVTGDVVVKILDLSGKVIFQDKNYLGNRCSGCSLYVVWLK